MGTRHSCLQSHELRDILVYYIKNVTCRDSYFYDYMFVWFPGVLLNCECLFQNSESVRIPSSNSMYNCVFFVNALPLSFLYITYVNKFYTVAGRPSIYLYPSTNVACSDSLYISIVRLPTVPFDDGGMVHLI